MARGGVRAGVRDPRRRPRPRLPAPRERARAVARARPRVRAHLDAQRDARVRRREDVEVARQRRLDPQRARHVGERGRAALLHDGALAQADRLHRRRRSQQAKAQVETLPQLLRRRRRRAGEPRRAGAFEAALDDDFNTPDALALFHDWRARELAVGSARAGSSSSGSARSPSATTRRPRCVALAEAAAAGARGEGLRRGRPAARRDRGAGWDVRDVAGGFELVPRDDARAGLRPARRCARRCAARTARCSSSGRPSAR